MEIFSFFYFFILFILFHAISPNYNYDYLNKYDSIEIDGSNTNFIIFHSSGFSKFDTIHFQFTSLASCFNFICFQFEDYIDIYNPSKYEIPLDHTIEAINKNYEIINEENYTKFYYDIRKSEYYLKDIKGDYLILGFQCDAKVIIKNNIFDHASSGLSDDALISIIVCCSAAGIAAIIIIIYCCYKRRQNKPAIGYTSNGVMYPMPNPELMDQQPIPQGNSFVPMKHNENIVNPVIYGNNFPEVQINNKNPSNYNKNKNGEIPLTSASIQQNNRRASVAKPGGKKRKSVK